METLLALTVLRLINFGFGVNMGGKNSNMVSLENRKGNKVYVKVIDDTIEVSAYKVSARCYHKKIYSFSDIDIIVNEIITKLNMK
jgi:hypothetical protein